MSLWFYVWTVLYRSWASKKLKICEENGYEGCTFPALVYACLWMNVSVYYRAILKKIPFICYRLVNITLIAFHDVKEMWWSGLNTGLIVNQMRLIDWISHLMWSRFTDIQNLIFKILNALNITCYLIDVNIRCLKDMGLNLYHHHRSSCTVTCPPSHQFIMKRSQICSTFPAFLCIIVFICMCAD